MVNDKTDPAITNALANIDFEQIDTIVRKYVKAAAIGGVLIYAAVKTIDTTSEVIVNIAPKR
jgi:hypothetical protein